MSDQLTMDALRAALSDRQFHFFRKISSTQDFAREWALSDPKLPGGQPGERLAVVITEQQTAGRGRQGRTWHSPPDSSIMFSAILKPDLPSEKLSRVTMAGATAVAEALFPTLRQTVTLKWPNDILINGKKAGGVLSEAIWLGDTLAAVILGVGLNIRVDLDQLDAEMPPTNVEDELGRPVKRLDLLRLILLRLDHWAAHLDSDALFEAWKKRLSTLGQRVTVSPKLDTPTEVPTSSYSGVAESVDEMGALLVRLDNNELRRVLAADVRLAEARNNA
jgi:BirA family biotin operon repressor/biotin-[acetyl-CoA-carboxylase] ligase